MRTIIVLLLVLGSARCLRADEFLPETSAPDQIAAESSLAPNHDALPAQEEELKASIEKLDAQRREAWTKAATATIRSEYERWSKIYLAKSSAIADCRIQLKQIQSELQAIGMSTQRTERKVDRLEQSIKNQGVLLNRIAERVGALEPSPAKQTVLSEIPKRAIKEKEEKKEAKSDAKAYKNPLLLLFAIVPVALVFYYRTFRVPRAKEISGDQKIEEILLGKEGRITEG